MGKIFGSSYFLLFTSRVLQLCFVAFAVGLICHKSAAKDISLGPFWYSKTKTMYLAYYDLGSIGSFHPENNTYYEGTIETINSQPNDVSFVMPILDQADYFVVSLGAKLGIFQWDGISDVLLQHKSFIDVVSDPSIFISAGATDLNGFLWLVTAPRNYNYQAQTGSLMWVDSNFKVSPPINITGLRDSIAFAANKFYYTYAAAHLIMGLNYDSTAKQFSNSIMVYDMSKHNRPESISGLTIDNKGNLWVACSNYILGINPQDGSELPKIDLPRQDGLYSISAVAFGGPTLHDLYATVVTTYNLNSLVRVHHPNVSITGVAGVPVNFS